jgi:predicted small lipoprotein YifL
VKPIFDLPRIPMIVAMVAATLSLAACGQKGPLFMPAKLPPPIVRTAPAKPNVAPATSDETMTPARPEAVDMPTTPATTK